MLIVVGNWNACWTGWLRYGAGCYQKNPVHRAKFLALQSPVWSFPMRLTLTETFACAKVKQIRLWIVGDLASFSVGRKCRRTSLPQTGSPL